MPHTARAERLVNIIRSFVDPTKTNPNFIVKSKRSIKYRILSDF